MEKYLRLEENVLQWKKSRAVFLTLSVEEEVSTLELDAIRAVCGEDLALVPSTGFSEVLDVLNQYVIAENTAEEDFDSGEQGTPQMPQPGVIPTTVHSLLDRGHIEMCKSLLKMEKNAADKHTRLATAIICALDKLHNLGSFTTAESPLKKNVAYVISLLRKFSRKMTNATPQSRQEAAQVLMLTQQAVVGWKLLDIAAKHLKAQGDTDFSAVSAFKYARFRLKHCFQEIISLRTWPKSDEDSSRISEAACGQFVQLIDNTLEILEDNTWPEFAETCPEEPDSILTSLSQLCEELLGHAMAVAHVALVADSELISGAAQMVLVRLQSLVQSKMEGAAMVDLRRGSLVDALLNLERQVNTCLLALVLEIFADPCAPLVALEESKCADKELAAFDLHVDRIMQTGLFAAACSSDAERVSALRSCLASLESLEPELVPALVRACQQPEGRLDFLANFYKQHWQEEVGKLADLLDNMIDPSAFAQVVSEKVMEYKVEIKLVITQGCIDKTQVVGQKMISSARKLLSFLQGVANIEEKSQGIVQDCAFYVKELDAALKQAVTVQWGDRVLKRARLLGLKIETLAVELEEMEGDEEKPTTNPHLSDNLAVNLQIVPNTPEADTLNISLETEVGAKPDSDASSVSFKTEMRPKPETDTLLGFPDSVSDLPLDIATPNPVSVAVDMTPYLTRAQRLCDGRNILYKTPGRPPSSAIPLWVNDKQTPFDLADDFAARKLLFSDSEIFEGDLSGLQHNLTEILDTEIEQCDTFTFVNSSGKIPVKSHEQNSRIFSSKRRLRVDEIQ